MSAANESYRPLVGFLALSLLWGSEWMLAASLPPQPALLSSTIRYTLAAIFLLPWALRDRLWRAPLRSLNSAGIIGACVVCLPQILIVLAGRGLPPVFSLAALAAVPVLLAVSGRGAIPTAVCGLGGVLFLNSSGFSLTSREAPWLLAPIGAAALLAYGIAKAESGCRDLPIAGVLFVQCAISAALFGIASLAFERQPVNWSLMAVAGLTADALLPAICGYLLFYWLIGKCGAAIPSMLQWTVLLVATMESAALMRIRPGWEPLLGALLIVLAVILGFSNRNDQGVMLQITRR